MADDDIFDFKDENISHLNLPSLHSFLQPVANPKTSKPTASKVRSMASTKPTTTKLTFNSHDPPMNRTRRGRPAAKFKIPKIPTFLPHVDPLIQLQPFNNNFNFVQTDNVSSPLFQCENLLAKENEAFEKLNSTISNVEPSRQTEDETARFHLLDDNCDDISMLNVTVPVNSIEKTLNILVGNQTNGNSDDNIEPIQNDFVNAEKFSNSTKDVTIKKDATLQITEVKTKEEAIKLLMTRLSNYDVIPNHAPIAKSDDRVNALLYPDDCSILINSLSPDPLERSFFRLSLAHEALINVSPVFSEDHLTTRDLATVKDDSSVGTHYTTASKFEVYVDTSIPLTDNSSVHLHPDQQTASLNTKSDASILSVSKAQTLDILPIEKMASILSPLPIFEPTVEEILEKSCIIEANIQSLQEFMSSKNKHVIKAQSDYQLVKKEELILPNKNVASHTPSLRTSLLDTPSTLVKTSESINDNPFLSPGLGKPVSNLLEKFQSFVAHENDWIRFLLVGCNQHNVSPFSALFQNIADTQITKIGESTYSEVFLCKDKILTVIKIIPVRTSLEENQDSFYQENVYKEGTDIPYASRAMDVFNEVIMTKKLSPFFQSSSDNFNIDSTGFISYLHAYLVQGKYPEKLLGVWKEFDQEKSSENISPEHFPADQHFIILMMSYGGTDLEKFTLNSIHQAFSILQQLVVSIIYSQNKFEFEHRDLHGGNILIQATKNSVLKMLMGKLENDQATSIDILTHGVEIKIIDYTLSRMKPNPSTEKCIYSDLENDPEIFQGDASVNYQYEIYRLMKQIVHSNYCASSTNESGISPWSQYCPKTNALWIWYNMKFVLSPKISSFKKVQALKKIFTEMTSTLYDQVVIGRASLHEWYMNNRKHFN